jgi:hypothetical protein
MKRHEGVAVRRGCGIGGGSLLFLKQKDVIQRYLLKDICKNNWEKRKKMIAGAYQENCRE